MRHQRHSIVFKMSSAYWTHGSVFINVVFLIGNGETSAVYSNLCV